MRFLPRSFLNPVSLAGLLVVVLSLGASIVLLALELLAPSGRPYQGILTFFVFPAFLLLGLLVVPLGALAYRKRLRRRAVEEAPYPVLDFNNPRKRRFYLAFLGSSLLILLLSIVGGYEAYEFTESVSFCGETCHTVMEPELVSHQDSPHARVKCVECHVGPGPEWYVRSKFSGLRQLWEVLTSSYPRPVPAPVETLRPAPDTCQECHWPEKHFGTQLSSRTRFAYDGLNRRRDFMVFVKTGGGGLPQGQGEGIHWHMNLNVAVEYVARDDRRTEIAWVRSRSPTGETVLYVDPDKPPTPEELAREPRRMDCVDCHNRPAHVLLSPDQAVDRALASGLLDPSFPHLKAAAVAALAEPYPSREEADRGIEERLKGFYEGKVPALSPEAAARLPAAASALRAIHRRNFFPSMQASWAAYPDHIGHRESPGCFRCHDGQHRSEGGKVLGKECELCHTFARRAPDGSALTLLPADGSFLHPWKHEKHSRMNCWDCHSGKSSPYGGCGKCHELEEGAPMAFTCATCHEPLKVKVENGDCTPCHDLSRSKLHLRKEHQDCLACHKQHEWKTVTYPDDCTGSCHQSLKEPHHPGEPCSPCHDFRGVESRLAPASR